MTKTPLPMPMDSQTDCTGDVVSVESTSESRHHSSCNFDETTGQSITTLDFDHYFAEDNLLDTTGEFLKQGKLLGVDLMVSDNCSLSRSETTVGEMQPVDIEEKAQPMNDLKGKTAQDNIQISTTGSSNVDGLMELLKRMGAQPRSESNKDVTRSRNLDTATASHDARAIIARLESLVTHVPRKIPAVSEEEIAKDDGVVNYDDESLAQIPNTAGNNDAIPEQGDSTLKPPPNTYSDGEHDGTYSQQQYDSELSTQSNIDPNEESRNNDDSQMENQLRLASADVESQSYGAVEKNYVDSSIVEIHKEAQESGVADSDTKPLFTAEDSENFSKSSTSEDDESCMDGDELQLRADCRNDDGNENMREENQSTMTNGYKESDQAQDNLKNIHPNKDEEIYVKDLTCEEEDGCIANEKMDKPTEEDESEEDGSVQDDDDDKEEEEGKEDGVTAQQTEDYDTESEEVEDEDDFDADDSAFLPNEYLQTPSLPTNPMNLDLLLEECEDYSDSSDDSEYTDSSGGISFGSSEGDSDDDFSDEEYDDLMSSMPIALGRSRDAPPIPPLQKPVPPPVPVQDMPFGGGEGLDLSMLASLRTELQKVGTMIAFNKEGEKFVRRAHILASINNLASNIPACVISHLGQEIRDHLLKKEAKNMFETSRPARRRINIDGVVLSSGTESVAGSSDGDSVDSSFSDQNRAGDKGQKRRLVRRISAESLESASGSSVSGASTDSGEQNSYLSLDDFLGSNHRPSRRSSMSSSMSWSAQSSSDDDDGEALPAIASFEGALMFVDISGFTRLSTVLDPEKLSKVINSYFQKIVEMIYQHSGDIQKFAGDALFAEWRVTDKRSKEQCIAEASTCASSLISECTDFPVLSVVSAQELIGSSVDCLNIHLGLGFGQMNGIHVGDNRHRREYLYIGDAIDQATTACDKAKLGQAVGSEEFLHLISQQCKRQKSDPENSLLIADRSGSFFDTSEYNTKVRNAKSRGVTEEVDGLEADALIEYRRLMSLYVHPVVVSNDIAAANDFETSGLGGSTNDKQKEEAELRSVYVMFIELTLPINLSGDLEQDTEVIHLLNDVMNLVTNKLKHYTGHLRQFIVDDKGFIMIATFGLRGSTFPNLVTERALPATMLIQKALEVEFGVKAKIGATFGDVYCGAVGGSMRSEYSVMGPSVNLAARLMHSPDNPGVLVDNRVRQVASRSYSFEALPAITAKGYSEPVPIFVPVSVSKRTWGSYEPNFVGREKEISQVVELAQDTMLSPQSESKFAIINGPSGMGKTKFLVHALDSMRKQLEHKAQNCGGMVFINHICLDSEMLVHFATFQTIFATTMKLYALSSSDDSSSNLAAEGELERSQSSDTIASDVSHSKLIETIRSIGRDIQAPPDLIEYATRYSLETNADLATRKSPPRKAVAAFLANAFLRCIEDVGLVVIAIDDIHFTDEVTWLILKRILDYANNVILIGTSPVEKSMFRASDYFWEVMDNHYGFSGRFLEITLGPLTEEEISLLITKRLNIETTSISPDLLHEVMLESGGMPQFAMNVLDIMADETMKDDSERGDKKRESSSDIILHRVDALDVEVRSTLNIGAVLGDKFCFGDLVRVLMAGADSQEKDVRTKVASSLKIAVQEGILVLHDDQGSILKGKQTDFDSNADSTSFSFFKSTWRNTLLGLMLGSRQRDVHRKTAENMESRLSEDSSLEEWLKLFVHWKSSGSTHNAAEVALSIGSLVEESPQAIESISVFESSLGMFGWQNINLEENCGFSSDILSVLAAEDIADIIRLSVGLGVNQEACNLRYNSYITFANAIRVMDRAKNAPDIKDRSILFPAYMGLSRAFSDGEIEQDSKRCYEQAMLYRLLEETRRHGRRVHHIHTLFLQMVLFARIGELEKAIAAQSVIRTMYKPIKHTVHLRNAYGFDTGAASFSLCSFYHEMLGNRRQAQSICRSILKRVVPIIDSGPSEAFLVLYPLLLVLKHGGYAAQAKEILEIKLMSPFGTARQCVAKQPYYGDVVEALTILLELSSNGPIKAQRFDEIATYAVNRAVSKFGAKVNIFLGRLGRCGDSIIAEICLEVAKKTPDSLLTQKMARYGLMVSSFAASFNRRQGLLLALANIEGIRNDLQEIGSSEPGQAEEQQAQ